MRTTAASLSLYILTLTPIVSSCIKEPTDIGLKDDDFRLENYSANSDLSVDIYPSEADYINGTNAIGHYTITNQTTATFPASKLKEGKWYYVDVYNSDHTLTNWVESDNITIAADSASQRRFKYNTTEKVFPVSAIQTNARRVLLKTATSSQWKAVDAIDLQSEESVWYMLPAAKRYVTLTINKNHTGEFRYLENGSASKTFSFNNNTMVGYPLFRLFPDEPGFDMFIINTNTHPVVVPDPPATGDTLITLFNDELYLLERQ